MDYVDEIKNKLSIVDLVSQYVQLKKAGRNFKGLCPFHNEKTPSFIVSPEKGIAYCFGCHKGGDIFKFIQEVEGVEFHEALTILADKANVKIERSAFSSKKSKERKNQKEVLYAIHQKTLNFFKDQLLNTENGKKVLKYLENRDVTKDMAKVFDLGFAPDSFDSLYKYLLKEGFKKEEIFLAGVVSSKDFKHANVYDKFRGRLIFPIFDNFSKCIAFTGRALQKELLEQKKTAKYLNSPESLIYNKSKVLYGLNLAKQEIKKNDFVLVVEGNMDVIASYFADLKNVVASSGTALTEYQLKELSKFTKNIYFCFDSDDAGIDATLRAVSLASKLELNIKIVTLKGAKDPADFIKENSKEDFHEAVNGAKYFLDYFLEKFISENDITQSLGVKKVIELFLPLLRDVRSSVERDFYFEKLASRLKVRVDSLYEDFKKLKEDSFQLKPEKVKVEDEQKDKISVDGYLMGLLYQYPEVFLDIIDRLKSLDLNKKYSNIINVLIEGYDKSSGRFKSKESLSEKLSDNEAGLLDFLSLYAESKNQDFDFNVIKEEVEKIIDKISVNQYILSKNKIIEEMNKARENGDLDLHKKLFEEYSKIISKD